jgi:hypothetical protein
MEEMKANIGERIGTEKRERIKAGLNGHKGKRNLAAEAIDESGARGASEPMPQDTPPWAMVLNRNVMQALANDQEQGESLADHEGRISTLEAKPSFIDLVKGLASTEGDEAKKTRQGVKELVIKADTEALPWGVRHVVKARRSTFGQVVETVALVAVAGFATYVAGDTAYGKIKGGQA